jgi:cellulose synthase/poly-beta-1,6-N-acetylglucosamine synthase-like glycosyltransferase
MLHVLFFLSMIFFAGTYLGFLYYVRKQAKKPWNINIDRDFQPTVSIIVPAHNEEAVICKKLGNLSEVKYPNAKIEIIVVDDASEDKTLERVESFVANHRDLNIKVLKQYPRAGKSAGLNLALGATTNSIVIVSDADTLWTPDVLEKAVPYLADAKIGAICGMGINENASNSWITKAEETYLNYTNLIRIGESKRYSTIRFEGGFCAYKKGTFREFDCETGSDDSGTALDVVQHDYRTILVPEVLFTTCFPTELVGKLRVKTRRATQLIGLWSKCLKLLVRRELKLPNSIAIPEFFLFIFNPLVFGVLIVTTLGLIVSFPFSWLSLLILVGSGTLLVFLRRLFLEVLVNNFVLLYALARFLSGRRYLAWQKTKIGS